MILDSLQNVDAYRGLAPDIIASLLHLKTLTPDVDLGEYQVTEDAKCIVSSYETGNDKPDQFEAHRHVIDVQFPIVGRERIEWSDLGTMVQATDYDPAKDRAFYATPQNRTSLVIGGGYFAVFFPRDAHRPALSVGEPETIKKVTMKVRCSASFQMRPTAVF